MNINIDRSILLDGMKPLMGRHKNLLLCYFRTGTGILIFFTTGEAYFHSVTEKQYKRWLQQFRIWNE